MTTLQPGGNAPVAAGHVRVDVNYSPIAGVDIDVSAFVLNGAGKVRGDGDMCFYGQTSVLGGAVQMTESAAGRAVFALDLSRLDPAVEKVALTATIYENKANFDKVSQLALVVGGDIEAQIPTHGMSETALILGEFYLRQGAWKFRCVGQGFAGGLEPLAKHFGVEVAAPAPSLAISQPAAPAPVSPAASQATSRSVTKALTLSKNQSISLEKTAGSSLTAVSLGLGWDPVKASGFFGKVFGIVDLDASCIVLDRNEESIDLVWFRKLKSKDGSIKHSGDNMTGRGEGDDETISVDLLRLPSNVQHLVFTVNSFLGQTFDKVENAYCRIVNESNNEELARFNLSEKGAHTGVVMARLSRQSSGWEFKAIGQSNRGRTAKDLVNLAIAAVRT